MGLINFKDIDFNKSINKENKIINFNGSEIQIVKYLSAQDKYDLIMITLQKSKENNIYNKYLLDIIFDLNIIYLYTNIVFNAEDRADEAGLYDILKRSGLIDAVKQEIPADELESLRLYVDEIADLDMAYSNAFLSRIENLLTEAPQFLEKFKKVVETFADPEKIKIFTELLQNRTVFQNTAE